MKLLQEQEEQSTKVYSLCQCSTWTNIL